MPSPTYLFNTYFDCSLETTFASDHLWVPCVSRSDRSLPVRLRTAARESEFACGPWRQLSWFSWSLWDRFSNVLVQRRSSDRVCPCCTFRFCVFCVCSCVPALLASPPDVEHSNPPFAKTTHCGGLRMCLCLETLLSSALSLFAAATSLFRNNLTCMPSPTYLSNTYFECSLETIFAVSRSEFNHGLISMFFIGLNCLMLKLMLRSRL
jgi:hypothetical protein